MIISWSVSFSFVHQHNAKKMKESTDGHFMSILFTVLLVMFELCSLHTMHHTIMKNVVDAYIN